MQRTTIPNLRDEGDWYELGYETGDADYPLARARITPLRDEEPRVGVPINGTTAPPRVRVLLSVSLVDETGSVLAISGQLLVGPETTHSRQFDADTVFDPVAWLDGCAEGQIEHVLRWARGLAAAAANRLLPA